MTRFLIDGLAIAAIALTAVATPPPARADGELLGLLLGIGTVYAIGKGIEQARTPEALTVADTQGFGFRGQRLLPRDCLATFETWHGNLRGFDNHCLARAMPHPERLPESCAIDTRIGDRHATIYPARCLQLEGWDLATGYWHDIPAWRGGTHLGTLDFAR
jgi:hypothetical protein